MKYMLCAGNINDLKRAVRQEKIKQLKWELEQIKKDFQLATENLFKKGF